MKKAFLISTSCVGVLLAGVAAAQVSGSISNSNLNFGEASSAEKKALESLAPLKVEAKPAAIKLKPEAQKPKPNVMDNRAAELKRVQDYLNSITTLVADFTQVAPDGTLASGKFYLKRPGQMRWQYEPPTPVLIILDGWHFIYYDYELEQVSQLPIDSSLSSLLARKKIDLNDPDLVIEEFNTTPGAVRLKLYQKGKKEEGTLLLEFNDQPLKIRNIVVTDAQGQTTTVSLNKARFGMPLERSLFEWKDPRSKRK